jgi:hypothetical protein
MTNEAFCILHCPCGPPWRSLYRRAVTCSVTQPADTSIRSNAVRRRVSVAASVNRWVMEPPPGVLSTSANPERSWWDSQQRRSGPREKVETGTSG